MKHLPLLALMLFSCLSYAQEIEVEGEASISGLFSSEDILPFWMYTNTNTARGSESTFSGMASATIKYPIGSATLEGGTSWFYRNELTEEFQRADLYLQFTNSWLKVTAGAKRQDVEADGLSATNMNFLWSTNARPLPGIVAEANKPLRITDVFSVDWGVGHYSLNDDRYVDNVNVHYKRLGLIVSFNERSKLTARLQHFAQWGGDSPLFGPLRTDFDALVSVFFANRATETSSDQVTNRIGNHLGSYFVQYELTVAPGVFSFYHDHPFEDGSGTRLDNFPDGVWGLQFTPENKSIINSVLYEYIDSTDQSGRDPGGGLDGYFGNNVYRSGWSYEGNVIGLPFIIFDKNIELTDVNSPYTSNRTRAHHLGISGTFQKINWMLKTTYVTNFGTYRKPFPEALKNWHNYAQFQYTTEKYGRFEILLGADSSNLADNLFAAGVGYRYIF